MKSFLKFLKITGIVLGVLIALLVAIIFIAPFFINVDKYRPQILEIVNSNINGKLDIKKISLSLWGKIEIKIDDIMLLDSSNKEIVSTREAYFLIPFSSVFSGSPHVIFRLDKPDIIITKNKNGTLNVLTLIKQQSVSTNNTQTKNLLKQKSQNQPLQDKPSTESKPDDIKNTKWYSFIASSHIDVEVLNASVKFNDYALGFSQELRGFNLKLKDISISKPMHVNIWSDINTKFSNLLVVAGKIDIKGNIKPILDGFSFKNAHIELQGNLDNLDIKVQDLFHKSKAIPLNFKLVSTVSQDQIDLEDFLFNFHNMRLTASGFIKGLQNPVMKVNLKLNSNDVRLKEWNKLTGLLKSFDLDGSLQLSAYARGNLDSTLDYGAKLKLSNMQFKLDAFAHKPKLNLNTELSKDNIKNFVLSVLAPNNDLNINLNASSLLSAPSVNISVLSNSIDLDSLLSSSYKEKLKQSSQTSDTKKADTKTKKDTAKAVQSNTQISSSQQAFDIDKALDPIRENSFINKTVLNININIKKFVAMMFNVEINDIILNFKFKNLIAAIEKFYMKIWGGEINIKSELNIKPKAPIYALNLDVKNLNLKQAVASQLKSLHNTVTGTLAMNAKGEGKSLNTDKILKHLKLQGSFSLVDFNFVTIDIAKMLENGINEVIVKNADKISAIKDKKVGPFNNYKMRFVRFASNFSLQSGILDIPNTEIIAYQNEGVDIKGTSKLDLIADKIDAKWNIIDTYNLTKAKDISVSVQGINVNNVLVEKNKPFIFPVKIGCKLSSPCYDYLDAINFLQKIALNNIKNAAVDTIKKDPSKLKEQVSKFINPKGKNNKNSNSFKAPSDNELDKIKDKTKDLKKKFGF